MSHVATISVVFIDLDAVKIMAEQLGLEFVEGAKTYRWFGEWVDDYDTETAAYRNGIKPEHYGHCQHKLKVAGQNGAYEVGLMQNPNGPGLVPVWDNFGSNGRVLTDRIGRNGETMTCKYVEAAATRQLQRQGYSVSRQKLPDGTVRIVGKEKMKAYV